MTPLPRGMIRVGDFFVAREFGAVEPYELPGLGALCALFLDPLRVKFGRCTVHSGKRSEVKNAEVGGAPQSRHLYHRFPLSPAADVTFLAGTPAEWARYARALANGYGRGGVGRYSGHVHVDVGPRRDW